MAPGSTIDMSVTDLKKRRRLSVFFAITIGYGFYYVGRLSFSVAKKTMADENVFDVAQMGVIGSTLFFAYAIGKLVNPSLPTKKINCCISMG